MMNRTHRGPRLSLRGRRRAAALTSLLALATGGIALAPTVAHADTVALTGPTVTGTVSLTVPDVAKASNCANATEGGQGTKVPLTLVLNADDDYSYISFDLFVIDSDGVTVDATDIAFTTDEVSSGTFTGFLCSKLPVGSYTAVGEVCFDADVDPCEDAAETTFVTDAYRITSAHHYTVAASRSGRTVTGTLRDSGRAVPRASVAIQRKSGSRWVTAAHKTTDAAGRASLTGGYGSTYRVVYGTATSGSVTVPRAGTRLAAHRAHLGRHAWKVTGTLSGALHSGKRIHLQRKYGTGWKNTTKSCVTRANGSCAISFTQNSRHDNGVWYRLRFAASAQKNAASSSRFHITHR